MERRLKHLGFVETGKMSANGYRFLVYKYPFAGAAVESVPLTAKEDFA
jgi:hypothetical protein